jgi:hypothetical protein
MENYKPINFTYYNPKNSLFKAGKSDRERFTVYYCSNCENCEAYKNNKCIMLNGLYGQRCPYGKKISEEGFTKASRKCGELIRKAKELYGEVSYALKGLDFICFIGDYVFLNLPWLDNYVNPIRSKGFFFSEGLIHMDNFTSEFVVELINYRPRAMMGGYIIDYSSKYIPTFVRQLRQKMPEMYDTVRKICTEIDEIGTLKTMNFIGKRALVKTLRPCKIGLCGDVHVAEWDGTVIKTNGRELGWLLDGNEVVTIVPTDNTYVRVMDNSSVTENTIFE